MTGMADSAFDMADDPERARKDALARHPAGRFGQPEDIASLALWLASDEAGFATGQCYTLDGGMTSASPLNPGLFQSRVVGKASGLVETSVSARKTPDFS
jgi:meso-butanediol dehydrogenase/(S,S)-butanediol dehydrogenase/diacetyl reductase